MMSPQDRAPNISYGFMNILKINPLSFMGAKARPDFILKIFGPLVAKKHTKYWPKSGFPIDTVQVSQPINF